MIKLTPKQLSLLVLVLQNSTFVIILRYSRLQPGPKYISSTAVVLAELLKLIVYSIIIAKNSGEGINGLKRALEIELIGKPKESLKLLVPAGLYTLQNNLQFVAISNLSPAIFQV